MQLKKVITLLVIVLLAGATAVAAQTGDAVSGRYEGVARGAEIGEMPITAELKNEGGKLTGKIETPQGPAMITSGSIAGEMVTLKLDIGGNELLVTAKLQGNKLVGEWELAGQKGTIDLTRKDAASTPAAPAAAPASGDVISGEWAGAADVQGTSVPFTLRLKLEGEKVTGESESPQGKAAISKGSWANDKLNIVIDTEMGPITLNAVLKEGKLVGDIDVASQVQGKWEAKKK
ncbi:MAG TPA: hypothetical protein VJQ56_14845 [Blastocatellia bacterium]|nr:hypothetical protein [Blastocatellia bacterium]